VHLSGYHLPACLPACLPIYLSTYLPALSHVSEPALLLEQHGTATRTEDTCTRIHMERNANSLRWNMGTMEEGERSDGDRREDSQPGNAVETSTLY
jgi:hypothetical protein